MLNINRIETGAVTDNCDQLLHAALEGMRLCAGDLQWRSVKREHINTTK